MDFTFVHFDTSAPVSTQHTDDKMPSRRAERAAQVNAESSNPPPYSPLELNPPLPAYFPMDPISPPSYGQRTTTSNSNSGIIVSITIQPTVLGLSDLEAQLPAQPEPARIRVHVWDNRHEYEPRRFIARAVGRLQRHGPVEGKSKKPWTKLLVAWRQRPRGAFDFLLKFFLCAIVVGFFVGMVYWGEALDQGKGRIFQ
jgi:hypothetical protein